MQQVRFFLHLTWAFGIISFSSAWKISDGNYTCTMLDGFISISINYKNANNQTTHKHYEFRNTYAYLEAGGIGPCKTNDGSTSITIAKYDKNVKANTISFIFRQSERNVRWPTQIPPGMFAIVGITVSIQSDDPGQILDAMSPPDLVMFPTLLGSTYFRDVEIIHLKSNGSGYKWPAVEMEITMTKFRYRAFIEPPKTPAPSSGISRSKVISNAETWLHPPVPYSQSKYKDGYRTDCSGYVSMAWEAKSNYTTDTLLGITTALSKDDLKSGDILLKPKNKSRAGHVTIFKEWVDSSKNKYWGYELVGGKINQAKFWKIPYPYWHNDQEYEPRRYVNIQPNLPDSGWKLKNKNTNQTCLYMNAIINLSINYTNNVGQIKHTDVEFKYSNNAYCEGECRTNFGDQTIMIYGSFSPLIIISFLFQRADTDYERVGEVPTGKYYIAEISASTRAIDLPNSLLELKATRLTLFPTPYYSSFSSPFEKVFIKDEFSRGKPEVEITLKDVHFQAFLNGYGNKKTTVVPRNKEIGYDNMDGLAVPNGSQKERIRQLSIVTTFILVFLSF